MQRIGVHGHVAGDADVAADAFADVVERPSSILRRQERIGDRGPRRADEVENAAPHLGDHGVGRGEAADADHRLAGQLLDEGDVRLLAAFVGEARGLRIIAQARDIDVPEIGQFAEQRHDLARLAVA